MRTEIHNLDGHGDRDHEVYDMAPAPLRQPDGSEVPGHHDYWAAVTNVPCPVEGCDQTVVWFEAGYVPGYRVCMARVDEQSFDPDSIRHRFLARGNGETPSLVRE